MVRLLAFGAMLLLTGPSAGTLSAFGQTFDDLIDYLASEESSTDVEMLFDLYNSPIDFNRASEADLAQLPFLSRTAAAAIIRLRDDRGGIRTLEELESIESVAAEHLQWLSLFVVLHPPAEPSVQVTNRERARLVTTSRVTRRLERSHGYAGSSDERRYLGSPERLYHRISLTRGGMSGNVTFDKRPGEPFVWEPEMRTFGYAFASGHLQLDPATARFVRRIVVGDYTLDYGQGLSIASGSFVGKGRETVRAATRNARGIRGTGSTLRDGYHRGIAASLEPLPGVEWDLFFSARYRDASVDSTIDDAGNLAVSVRSIAADPLHRTTSERLRRRALREKLVGSALSFTRGAWTTGVTLHHVRYSPTLIPIERLDLFHIPPRSQVGTASVYGHIHLPGIDVFGEVARSAPGGVVTVGGVLVSVRPGLEGVIAYRNYAPSYANAFASGFGHQRGSTRNERGLYAGFRAPLSDRLKLSAYLDQFEFPWLRFGSGLPSSGYDWLLEIEYRPRRWWTTHVLTRGRVIEENLPSMLQSGRVAELTTSERGGIRVHSDLRPDAAWRLQVRAEYVQARRPPGSRSDGYLLYHDIDWHPASLISISTRMAFFGTADGAARLYAYERDLTGTFSLGSYAGHGIRRYLLIALRPAGGVTLQIKLAETHYDGVRSVGTGTDQIDGNRVREIRLQLRMTV